MISKISANITAAKNSSSKNSPPKAVTFGMNLEVNPNKLYNFLCTLDGTKLERKKVFQEIVDYTRNYNAEKVAEEIFNEDANQSMVKSLKDAGFNFGALDKIFIGYTKSKINILNFAVNNQAPEGPTFSVLANLGDSMLPKSVRGLSTQPPITKIAQVPPYVQKVIDSSAREVIQKEFGHRVRNLKKMLGISTSA